MGGVDPDLLNFMMGHTLPYRGAYDLWTLEDLKRKYKQAEKYVSIKSIHNVTKEDLQMEVLRVLFVKMSQEDLKLISQNLGIPTSQIINVIM